MKFVLYEVTDDYDVIIIGCGVGGHGVGHGVVQPVAAAQGLAQVAPEALVECGHHQMSVSCGKPAHRHHRRVRPVHLGREYQHRDNEGKKDSS